jgi:hypothetical protein
MSELSGVEGRMRSSSPEFMFRKQLCHYPFVPGRPSELRRRRKQAKPGELSQQQASDIETEKVADYRGLNFCSGIARY